MSKQYITVLNALTAKKISLTVYKHEKTTVKTSKHRIYSFKLFS